MRKATNFGSKKSLLGLPLPNAKRGGSIPWGNEADIFIIAILGEKKFV